MEAKKPNPTSSTHAAISLAAAVRLSAMVLMSTSVVAAWLLSAQAMLTSADVTSEVTKKLNRGELMTNPWGPPFFASSTSMGPLDTERAPYDPSDRQQPTF